MSEIISKIWSKVKDGVYAKLKEAASMLLEGLKQRASTLDGKYSITVGVQMLALLIIGLMTIACNPPPTCRSGGFPIMGYQTQL